MKLDVLYEDNHLIIINKPNGLLVHGDETGDEVLEDMVKDYLRVKYKKPGNVFAHACHRLDRPVSGVLIFARTSKGAERMAKLFQAREIKKTYWALSHLYPKEESGTIKQYILKDRRRNVSSGKKKPVPGAKEAITEYKLLGRGEPFYLFELYPKTGRAHQIRVMMRSIGSPILGDLKYHGEQIKNKRAILLHCRKMEFMHPIKKIPISITAPLPNVQAWHTIWHLIPKGEVR